MKILKPTQKNINLAVEYLKEGKAVVFPTNTAYGLGVDATNLKAIKRLYEIKKRKPKKPVHIVVDSLKMAKRYANFSKVEEKLFKKFMPGRLTLVLELKTKKGSAWKVLSAGTGTIGIRMPKNKIALNLVKKLKRPITATSANISSSPTAHTIIQLQRQYASQEFRPDLVLSVGNLRKVEASTIVKLDEGRVQIIRRGPVTKKQIDGSI